jgi:hypothetical protein
MKMYYIKISFSFINALPNGNSNQVPWIPIVYKLPGQ